MNLVEKFSRYVRIAKDAGELAKDSHTQYNAYSYQCLSQFFDPVTTCKANILSREDRKDKIVVCFKGSKTLDDWFRDAWIWKLNWPFAKQGDDMKKVQIHAGFKNEYQSVRVKLIRELSDLITASPVPLHITFVGHSLGGALASIAALDVCEVFGKKAIYSVYTYGSPRVYNLEGHNAFVQRMDYAHRTVYAKDIVPQMPIWGYKHVGSPIHVTTDLKLEYIEYEKSFLECSAMDHFVENYVDAMRFLMNLPEAEQSMDQNVRDDPADNLKRPV